MVGGDVGGGVERQQFQLRSLLGRKEENCGKARRETKGGKGERGAEMFFNINFTPSPFFMYLFRGGGGGGGE